VGKDQFIYAVHLISTLKHIHQVPYPIQVVYASDNDLPIEYRLALKGISEDVETFDVLHFFDEKMVGIEGIGWSIKVFAILASPFEQVM
jgi:hypothetical protein